jgi:predicted O-methyltransferase YrrM
VVSYGLRPLYIKLLSATFQHNLEASGQKDKITVMRGCSHTEVIKLEDKSFDIIYIDGNHASEYVCEDGVLAFRKLKVGGVMIFDDYWHGGDDDMVKRGVDAFCHAYRDRLRPPHLRYTTQLFVTKSS